MKNILFNSFRIIGQNLTKQQDYFNILLRQIDEVLNNCFDNTFHKFEAKVTSSDNNTSHLVELFETCETCTNEVEVNKLDIHIVPSKCYVIVLVQLAWRNSTHISAEIFDKIGSLWDAEIMTGHCTEYEIILNIKEDSEFIESTEVPEDFYISFAGNLTKIHCTKTEALNRVKIIHDGSVKLFKEILL